TMVESVHAPVADPLPVLATPLFDATGLANVATAYDAAIVPFDLLDDALPPADLAYAERWSRLSLTVTGKPGANLTTQVWLPNASAAALATSWLACNDGSREIADFIHLARPVGALARLTLIHVKPSSSDSAARQISLGDYELVVSQAVKNLRFLEIKRLRNE